MISCPSDFFQSEVSNLVIDFWSFRKMAACSSFLILDCMIPSNDMDSKRLIEFMEYPSGATRNDPLAAKASYYIESSLIDFIVMVADETMVSLPRGKLSIGTGSTTT